MRLEKISGTRLPAIPTWLAAMRFVSKRIDTIKRMHTRNLGELELAKDLQEDVAPAMEKTLPDELLSPS